MKNSKTYKLSKLIEKQGRVWTTAAGGVIAAAMVFGASQSMAVTATNTENYTVSVVVDNAFTMTETTPISFGTISALSGETNAAVLTLNGQTGIGICRHYWQSATSFSWRATSGLQCVGRV